MLPATPAGALLLLTGKDRGATLAGLLSAQRCEVTVCEVYEAAAVPELPEPAAAALRDGGLSAVLHFSAETARLFVRLVVSAGLQTQVRGIGACAISGPAAMALEALPWRRLRIAARPTQDAMLALLR